MTMREMLEQQMKLEGEDVRRVLIRVLQEEQSKIDMKTPIGIIKAVKTIVIEEAAKEGSS
jgi:hypothetical protein